MYPGKQHIVQDDIESFAYVVLYHALRYLKHSALSDLRKIMIDVFDDFDIDDAGVFKGGKGKSHFFSNYRITLGAKFKFISNSPLNSWFKYTISAVGQWHNHMMELMGDEIETTADLPLGDISHLTLKDHAAFGAKWYELLQLPDWPTNETPVDQLPAPQKLRQSSSKRGLRDTDESDTPSKKVKSSPHQPTQGSRLGKYTFTPRD
jgi:hypothetical protein